MVNCVNVWVIWVTRILNFIYLTYLSFAFASKIILFTTPFTIFKMLGTNSDRFCVSMSFRMQDTFYCCVFLFYSIYLYQIYCYIYQVFVRDKDLLGLFLLLTLPVYLITGLLLQLLLNFVKLSHFLKLFIGDWITNKNYLIFYFTINTKKITFSCFLFQSGNKLINWFIFSLSHLAKIIYFKS